MNVFVYIHIFMLSGSLQFNSVQFFYCTIKVGYNDMADLTSNMHDRKEKDKFIYITLHSTNKLYDDIKQQKLMYITYLIRVSFISFLSYILLCLMIRNLVFQL